MEPRELLTAVQSKVWLIYKRQQCPTYARMSLNVTREVCDYLCTSVILPCIHANVLTLHYLDTGAVSTLELTHYFTKATVFCFYRERLLLCVGRLPASTEVWSLDVDTGAVLQLQDTLFVRAWCGIVKYGETVYVFGGNPVTSMRSGEGIGVYTRRWRRLQDMSSPKVAFTPCVYKREIYLACPMPQKSLFEVFNPINETFRPYSVYLRSPAYGCVYFVADNLLLMITYSRQLVTWSIDSPEHWKAEIEVCDQANMISSTSPVPYKQQLWWSSHLTGKVVKFDLASSSVEEKTQVE